jgi:glutaredoxin-like protein NrdH
MNLEFKHVDGDRDDHTVRLLTLSTCIHCKQAKRLMKELRVSYEYIDVDLSSMEEKREIGRFLKENGIPIIFPVIIIDGEIITGYREDKIHELLD